MAEKRTVPKVSIEFSSGLLNRGVARVFSLVESSPAPKEKVLKEVFYLDENGDPRPKVEFTNPAPHPLEGLVYCPDTMSLTSLLNAGVVLKPAHLDMFSGDPSSAERAAVANFASMVIVDDKSSSISFEPTSQPPSESTSQTPSESISEPNN